MALTSDQDPRYAERVRYIEEKLNSGVTEEVRGRRGKKSWGSNPYLAGRSMMRWRYLGRGLLMFAAMARRHGTCIKRK